MSINNDNRGQWSSNFAFILAASGSAIGLGNIWRFPYLTGENGGAAFVFIYLVCVLFGLPLFFNEMALGRFTGKNPIGAFKKIKPGFFWFLVGLLCLSSCFFVLSYYSVIAGWTIGYIYTSLFNIQIDFSTFIATPHYVIPLFFVFMVLTILIVQGGIEKGIEKWSVILMPLLFLLLIIIMIRSITLEGAMEGIKYYLIPDFSKINTNVVLKALGQAFFSLGVGWGLMITYGSYMSKKQNIIMSSKWIAIADTSVALMAGFMIFPAVFAFGKSPAVGPTLAFVVLPEIFNEMPLGNIIGAAFFLLLMIAALTSTISMLEVPVSFMVDEKIMSRKPAAWLIGGLAFMIGLPSALSQGASETLSSIILFGKTGFLDIMDHVWGTIIIIITALLICVFVGWRWNISEAVAEIEHGSSGFTKKITGNVTPAVLWAFFIRYIAPLVIAVLLFNMLFSS